MGEKLFARTIRMFPMRVFWEMGSGNSTISYQNSIFCISISAHILYPTAENAAFSYIEPVEAKQEAIPEKKSISVLLMLRMYPSAL